ncbi:hypothetical protein ASC95_11155 [Pelomonas sp. Root1217]|uniref:transglutaminase-like domain-containing protein n=1 Tax=Pelomonas sp. Root1217 TaxID=1736430 RepID=UPI000712490B|nr:transglutaminase-like domain-containing protein [Pelomonas sp. Root1217]KQV53299.1 hypothetical protein ASC95_11155 [Pelomonas sp. Root1217]
MLAATLCLDGMACAQSPKWEPFFRFPGTFFPAFAISAAGRDANGPTESGPAYGYVHSGSLGIKLIDPPAGSKVKVQIEVPEIGVSGELETLASSDGKPHFLMPRLSLSEAKLARITQPLTTDAVFRLYVDGVQAGEERRPIRVRASNDAPLRACRAPTQCTDYSPYLAAFVNENHPAIDGLLRSALDIPAMPVKSWTGTQGSPDDVLRQVWAIWYLFQRNKVTYSSITTVSDSRPELVSQTVRPLSQTLRTAQANCIDGTAVFASVLRKIGIEPIIVLIPGHAFLGFYTDPQHKHPVFLETTMLNNANNPFHQQGPTKAGTALAKMLHADTHMNDSWASFQQALRVGQQNFEKAAPNFGKQSGFVFLPVLKAREAGVQPLPL